VIRKSWLLASLDFQLNAIHPAAILYCILQDTVLQQLCYNLSAEFSTINLDQLKNYLQKLSKQKSSAVTPPAHNTKTPALDQFTINLNQQAKAGKIDAAIGREQEIQQMIDILSRRRQNNPILVGEPGVGKTAIVEGLALKIISGDVPTKLSDIELRTLDLSLLQAGAGVKGEFERRLKEVIKEVQASATPIILFIDEAHTLIGSGNQAGSNDAANILKPALARGELRTIAATTWEEYQQYVEQDAALTRRFQAIKVGEPNISTAMQMLRSLIPSMQQHHDVIILDEAIDAAVNLTHKYLNERRLPDKAISALDTACARVAGMQQHKPYLINQLEHDLDQLQHEIEQLQHETSAGINHKDRLKNLKKKNKSIEKELTQLVNQWHQEKNLINKIKKLMENDEEKSCLPILLQQLKTLQGKQALTHALVNRDVIASVIADWTGIPVGNLLQDEAQSLLHLEQSLQQQVIGQTTALKEIAAAVKNSSANISDPNKPRGVFLLVGPSGVGKTETALTLAEQVYSSRQNITVINMSEFKEAHKVSLLTGSPPGYVGYGKGGVLTEAVRRKPYSLILLDEMEKAHPSVQDIFYQVFDKGMLQDGQGRDVNFKNSMIVMTSNAASDEILALTENDLNIEEIQAKIQPTLRKYFKSAFLGRVKVIPYLGLSTTELQKILQLQLNKLQQRIQNHYHVNLTLSDKTIHYVIKCCQHNDLGARQMTNIIEQQLMPVISSYLLQQVAEQKQLTNIDLHLNAEKRWEVSPSPFS
jgi:type VI secretion system protein VasG